MISYIIIILYKVFKEFGNDLITICMFLCVHKIAITDYTGKHLLD